MICPTGFIIMQFRNVMMYGMSADYLMLLYWLAIGLILSFIGVKILYRGEKGFHEGGVLMDEIAIDVKCDHRLPRQQRRELQSVHQKYVQA